MRIFCISVPIFIRNLQILLLLCLYIDVAGGVGVGGAPLLIYNTRKDIRLVNASRAYSKVKTQILVRNLTEATALDFNYAAQKICWTDHVLEIIQCVSYNGLEVGNKSTIIKSGLISPDGLACDWFTNKLYWTDGETNRIEVSTMNGEYRKVLFWSDIDQPRAIALVPMRGLLFWTDWGEVPKIERAGMNGDPLTRKLIVAEHIFWPNGLTVDYDAELLYWVDGKLHFIAVMDYDGNHRKEILSRGLIYPFSITHFQSKLYWTDWNTSSVHVYERNATSSKGHGPKELIQSDNVPMCIHVWDASRQPLGDGAHACSRDNGGCSHLCLLSPEPPGYSCACPSGIKLLDDHKCADGPQQILLLAIRTDICLIYLDSPDYSHHIIPLDGIKYTIAVDYDPVNGFLYWTDDEVKAIRRAMLNGSRQEDVIVADVQHPDGLAIEWLAGNLYWTDTGTDRIEVARLNGTFRRVLVFEGLVEPRAIVVSGEHGWMFWSDWNEKQPKIERASLDGGDRVALVTTKLGWPNGLTLDLDLGKVYWCDAKTDKIEVANMDGTHRIELTTDNLPHTFGLSLSGDYLYWTDWQRRAIDRVHKLTGSDRETITDQMPNVMGLKAVNLQEWRRGSNPCAVDNGGCSHLCLNRPRDMYVCACQMTLELQLDARTCVLPDSFLLYAARDTIGRISIENANNHINDVVIPISGVKHASSLDFDTLNKRIYWTDTRVRGIYRAYMNGSERERVIELGVRAPCALAVDWLALNVYWVDSATTAEYKIEVARLDGSSRRALVWQQLDQPHSIAVEPQHGRMYWSEWGEAQCIKRAAMNGSQQAVLVPATGHARSLTIDHRTHTIYWVDTLATRTGIYSVSTLHPHTAITVITTAAAAHSLTLHHNTIYWTHITTGEIYACDKTSCANATLIHGGNGSGGSSGSEVVVVHSGREHHSNTCVVGNGGCTHLCLATSATTHVCACPTHYTLTNDTCTPPSTFMIYSQRNSVVRLVPDSSDYPEAVLPIHGLKSVKAVDFDPVSHYLYWIEGKTHSIKRALDNGSHVSLVVGGGGVAPFDLAIDSLGRMLFWTCSIQDVINVTRLENGSSVGVVVKKAGEKPRLLAIHPSRRLLVWTDNGVATQLVRARLDGSHRIVIHTATATTHNITAIALDLDNDMIVWAYGFKVYMCNIDGEDVLSILSENKATISEMVVHVGRVYWVDRALSQLRRLELKTAALEAVQAVQHVTALGAVPHTPAHHSCSRATCTHLCIGNHTTVLCACPQGLALQEDRRTCSVVPDCGREHWTCGRNRLRSVSVSNDCIPWAWRCDGQPDCADGSDEMGCPACSPMQFRCQSGQCIEQAWLCDGNAQCADGLDEAHCCNTNEEFKCPSTEVCIPVSQVCDGLEHCANGGDETPEVCLLYRGAATSALTPPAPPPPTSPPHTTTTAATTYVLLVVLITLATLAIGFAGFYCVRRRTDQDPHRPHHHHHEQHPLTPKHNQTLLKPGKFRGMVGSSGVPDVVHMSMLDGDSYERCHITGASSSTGTGTGTGSLHAYPRETLNPPPSPATTATTSLGRYHHYRVPATITAATTAGPYRHYRTINQPPPPTPCSTDVCDESDCNYPITNRYDAPPPTPRSHSESCPPSPSSRRSSTYFSPLPPPPSPAPPTTPHHSLH